MTELGSAYPEPQINERQLRPRMSAVIWLITTLIFSFLPFAVLPLIYHAFHRPHQWPSIYNLFGRGDLALVIVAVLGATIAELVLPSQTSDAVRAIMVAINAVFGMTAITIYTISQYQEISQEGADTHVNAIALGGLLVLAVSIQCFLIIKRRTGGNA